MNKTAFSPSAQADRPYSNWHACPLLSLEAWKKRFDEWLDQQHSSRDPQAYLSRCDLHRPEDRLLHGLLVSRWPVRRMPVIVHTVISSPHHPRVLPFTPEPLRLPVHRVVDVLGRYNRFPGGGIDNSLQR